MMRKRPDSLLDSFRSSVWLAPGDIGGSPCPQRNSDPLSRWASTSASRGITYACICASLEKHLVCGRIEKQGCNLCNQDIFLGDVAWSFGCLAWWLSWWLGWAPAHFVGQDCVLIIHLFHNDSSANSPSSSDNHTPRMPS